MTRLIRLGPNMPMPMPRISFTGRSASVPLGPAAAHLVDEMVACYAEWRGCARAVANAYWRWSESPPTEKDRLYSAYTASLEQEQAAAATYELAVVEVEGWLESGRR
jgi:hypothetical protein